MRRFFWTLLATLLLEGWFLNFPLWWIVTAPAIALSVRLTCGVVKAHRAQEELIARFNDENPPQPRKSSAMPAGRHRGHRGQPSGPIGHLTSCHSPSVPIIPLTAARAASSDVWP